MLIDKYVVAGQEYESQLDEDLHIDRFNLNEEFTKHSERFAWYATAYELAQSYENRLKVDLERLYALLDIKVRGTMTQQGMRITEKKVENAVITDNTYMDLMDRYQSAKEQTGVLKAARDAMYAKKDVLVSLGANIRAEMQSDPSLLMESYKNKHRE